MIASDKFRFLIVVFALALSFQVHGQNKKTYRIPGDTSIITLSQAVVIETDLLKLEIAEGASVISSGEKRKYKLYENTLASARDRLVLQNNKITEMLNIISSLETQLASMDTIANENLTADIEGLKKKLNRSNNDLEKVTSDLEKTTKKLKKQKKWDNILKGIIGAIGIAIGVVIGNAI